jgi:glycosyltransferase involved in cell wall biosynthesis
MATYNGERFIKQQIESILTQLGVEDELIISDDGSMDSTVTIIESFHDPRIKLLHHHQPLYKSRYYQANVNIASNFENALKHSNGDYIFLSDQDDIWAEGKVAKMKEITFFNKGVVMSSFTVIREDDSVKTKIVTPPIRSLFRAVIDAKFLGSSMCISRNFLNIALPFPRGIVSHDAWIGLLAVYNKNLTVIDEPLLLYRRHSTNATSKKKNTPLFYKLAYRLSILYQVIKRSNKE